MKVLIVIPYFMVIVDLTRAQLNLPEMPGPPYPDKYGNNRWGVKYDPRVHGHGRGRNQHSPSSSAYGGDSPQYSPSGRYRSPPAPPSRSKWTSALKPLVSRSPFSKSKSKRNRRPPGPPSSMFDPTSDSFYKDPYSSKSIDGYVKNYLNTYNKVSQTPVSNPDLVNIQNFARPTSLNGRFRPRNFGRNGNRRSLTSESSSSSTSSSVGSTGSLADSYVVAADLSDINDDKATYRTVNPQDDFFGPKISKKKSDFAKTLSTLYNDYKPGEENADSGIGSGNSAGSSSSGSNSKGVAEAATDSYSNSVAVRDDDYPPSYSSRPPPPRRGRPPPSSSPDGPRFRERQYYSGGSGKRPRDGPHYSSRGPPPPRSFSSGPLSSLDLYDDIPSYSSRRPPSGLYDIDGYSDSPMIVSSGDSSNSFGSSFGPGSYSSSYSPGPMSVSSYTSGPPPPSSLYSNSFDSFSGPGPFSSPFSQHPRGPPPPPPPPPISNPYASPPLGVAPAPQPVGVAPLSIAPAQMAPISYLPASGLYYPPALIPIPNSNSDSKPSKKSKRKKNRLQHTPMNVLRGLLGHRRERGDRQRDEDDERDTYKPAYAANYPIALPPPAVVAPVAPPQYAYSPVVNSLAGPLDYRPPLYADHPLPPHHPPHRPSPLISGLARDLRDLRDTLTGGYRDSPRRPPPPPPPPPPRYSSNNNNNQGNNEANDSPSSYKKEGSPPPGPITQHLQDWPRIFTAMGSSVDAVAGGIHAVRKEISKMTGQVMAKGVLMGGSTVHEVTKGVAHVITKMSHI